MIKSFHYIKCSGITLSVNYEHFKDKPYPLIWNNNGLYGFIPKERMENYIQIIDDAKNLPVIELKIIQIFWDEVELIDSKTATLLLK